MGKVFFFYNIDFLFAPRAVTNIHTNIHTGEANKSVLKIIILHHISELQLHLTINFVTTFIHFVPRVILLFAMLFCVHLLMLATFFLFLNILVVSKSIIILSF